MILNIQNDENYRDRIIFIMIFIKCVFFLGPLTKSTTYYIFSSEPFNRFERIKKKRSVKNDWAINDELNWMKTNAKQFVFVFLKQNKQTESLGVFGFVFVRRDFICYRTRHWFSLPSLIVFRSFMWEIKRSSHTKEVSTQAS